MVTGSRSPALLGAGLISSWLCLNLEFWGPESLLEKGNCCRSSGLLVPEAS